jgi:hypothetical protein
MTNSSSILCRHMHILACFLCTFHQKSMNSFVAWSIFFQRNSFIRSLLHLFVIRDSAHLYTSSHYASPYLSMCIFMLSDSIRVCPFNSLAVSFELIIQLGLSKIDFCLIPSFQLPQANSVRFFIGQLCMCSWLSSYLLIHTHRYSFLNTPKNSTVGHSI